MASAAYATTNDVIELYRPLTSSELTQAAALIPVVCAELRSEAKKRGKDLDQMISDDPDLGLVAKSVTVDVVARALMTPTSSGSGVMSQMSESALGYTVSGTFLNPGGGLFIKRTELRRLGILRQKVGVTEFYGDD